MRRLASDHANLEAHYDAIVVGSGYGAGVAASRLARMGLKVAVLERGREFAAGDFPDTMAEAQAELQVSGPDGQSGSPTGLFDIRIGRDMHVLVGCGLGGTSLINANVALPPDPRVFEDSKWPSEVLADYRLNEGFARARRMLQPTPYPNAIRLDKIARMSEAAKALGGEVTLPPVNIAFKAGVNAAGIEQPACTLCGDCCSGCNVGAKTTVDITYIADAVNFGATIFTEISVTSLRKESGGWRVFYEPQRDGSLLFDAPERSLSAEIVVLGAGSLGSTEILLRSKVDGLELSPRLGQGFTGNGDALAFAYNNDRSVNAVGIGHPPRASVPAPGPCIASAIDLRDSASVTDGLIIQEGAIPSGVNAILPALFATAAGMFGKNTDPGLVDDMQEALRQRKSVLFGSYQGAMANTQTFLVMGHDDGQGRLSLEHGRVALNWPGVSRQSIYSRIDEALLKATAATGGTYIRNPLQSTFLGGNMITVHPLGGCGMGADATRGVVNHKCQVFDTSPHAKPGAIHAGLYVCDGAIMPRPLGVNPLLTISALAERAMMLLADDIGRTLSDDPSKAPARRLVGAAASGPAAAGVAFTERMAGHVGKRTAKRGADTHAVGAADGAERDSTLSLIASVAIESIERFVADPERSGRITGTVTCAALSAEPLDISHGQFSLMRPDPEKAETRRFDYRLRLTSRDNRTFTFIGHKVVHADRMPGDLWNDTTTLFVDIDETTHGAAELVQLSGRLSIAPEDFTRQLQSIRGKGGANPADRLHAVATFGALFAGSLFSVYGSALAPLQRFDPTRIRKRRDLRTPAPQLVTFKTADGLELRMTRYKGGDKGPILFLHGLGVSSRIFSTDTIDTNLLEYMTGSGYDCWLLDGRASIDLPYARQPWTADDVARQDLPAAVHAVLEVTRASSLQVMAHCYGATTFTMAMLSGLQGVRSAVISQISTDVVIPFFPQRLLAHLRAPSLLKMLGLGHVDARATSTDGIMERIIDGLIRIFVPFRSGGPTRNATSNRITALYGQLYEVDKLNRLTFEQGLPEMFGEANIAAFQQLAAIARKQQIVDAKGQDSYLDHLERLAIPITFIHGEKNACFTPESTERTMTRLGRRNGRILYKRHVIPGYGHIDCIFGANAATDVYPLILAHFDETLS
jgi:cholesterol oxidase